MQRMAALACLIMASCTPVPDISNVTPAVPVKDIVYLDQGWTDTDLAIYDSTPQGSYIIPMPWFMALRRTDNGAAFTGDQLQRFGYLASDQANSLPVGFVQDGTASDPQLGMTCAACHTGQLRARGIVWRIEGGRAHADFQKFLTALGQESTATLADPARFAQFSKAVLGASATPAQIADLRANFSDWLARYSAFMGASLPDPAWGPGRLDAFGMIFNRVTGLDLKDPANIGKADAPARYPFIWDAPRQDHTQWTGAAPNGTYLRALARNTGEVFGVFGRLDPHPIPIRTAIYANSVNRTGLQALEERVVKLHSPPWPVAAFGLNQAQVARGATLFANQCAACHGVHASAIVSKAWDTPVRDVGTDPRAFDNSQGHASPQALTGTTQPILFGQALSDPSLKLDILANAVIGSLVDAAVTWDPAIRRAIEQDVQQGRLPLLDAQPSTTVTGSVGSIQNATKKLYKTPKQVPGAAYESRVLTGIWAVAPYLHNGSVPNLWELLKPASARMTSFAVGHEDFDPVHVGLQTEAAPGRTMFTADPAHGSGNGGHEYGTALSDPDKWALIEYLKTL